MRRFLVPACLSILLVGCVKPATLPVGCPPPPLVTEPSLRSQALVPDSGTVAVVEAYVLDLADWVSFSRKLEALLDGYRSPSPSLPPVPSAPQ